VANFEKSAAYTPGGIKAMQIASGGDIIHIEIGPVFNNLLN
jgi:hypothetical protein